MSDIFFDVTDLVAYMAAHGSVTGIQRVEARLLAELAGLPDADRVWCVAVDAARGGHRAWRLTEIFAEQRDEICALAGLVEDEETEGRWPSKRLVKQHLNQQGLRGWRRGMAKLDIAARARLAPASLEQRGFTRPALGMQPPACRRPATLPADGTLVMLGAGWNDPAIAAAARRHAQSGGRVVHCVYDLIPTVRPAYFDDELQRRFTRHFTEAIDYTSDFICISKHTQSDLNAFLEAHGRRAPSTVVPLAHEFAGFARNARGCQPRNPELHDFGKRIGDFLLCVGTLEIRKNGVALLEAWQHMHASLGDTTPHLVFCGRRGWKMEPFYALLAEHPWLRDRVHLLADANDADIAALHEQSIGSIYPSLYEGWGLPVGEAAWLGRTCITSKASSLPEVCGPLVDYIDPQSPASIAAAVERLACDADYRAWRERLVREAHLRTWRDVAAGFQEALFTAHAARRAA